MLWKHFCSPQKVKNEIKVSTTTGHAVAIGTIGSAIILTNKLIWNSSDGQRFLDSIEV